jgi:hypothetical protein
MIEGWYREQGAPKERKVEDETPIERGGIGADDLACSTAVQSWPICPTKATSRCRCCSTRYRSHKAREDLSLPANFSTEGINGQDKRPGRQTAIQSVCGKE